MALTFERLTPDRTDAFIDLRLAQLTEEGALDMDLRPALTDYFRRHLEDNSFVSWILTDGERILATSGISFVEKPPYPGAPNGRIGLLSCMYTDPSCRRQGIATQLLERIVQEARARDCRVIQVTASRMGEKLYQSFGFVRHARFFQLSLDK